MPYEFTTRWFADSELKRLLPQILSLTAENRILEIGAFEGQSTVYLADMYCAGHPGSSITTVDPFDPGDTSTCVTTDTEQRFLSNIKASPQSTKIIVRRQYSDDFFQGETGRYNFIYVDGSHEPLQIQRDASNAFRVLEVNGILWFDDYLGGPPGDTRIREAIDFWVKMMGGRVRIIHSGYQLGMVKVAE